MKKLIYLLLAFAFPLLAVTYGCGSKEENAVTDTLFTVPYISSLSIQEPERALVLIDSAEQEGRMTDFDVNRLRAVVYHNGLSDDNKALEYALKALELAEIYKTGEQALQIERQSASILVRNIVIAAAMLFLSLCIVFMVRVLRYNRIVSSKNRSMVKTLNELMGYKGKVSELQEELIRLQEKVASHTAAPTEEATFAVPPSAVAAAPSSSNGSAATVELTEFDRLLFERMDHEVIARRLFLNPDFSKASLLAEFPVPANKFSTFFKEYAGCTFSQYIHNCRLDYAVKLMGENPSWSIDAIAKAARMSNGSFYNQFKKRFGMSPSEYQKKFGMSPSEFRKDEGNLSMEE
ncbi:helix-turn-helix domain-containing protein [Bacteroides sp.]|uniref:helix-turn-helix domain-containing protein n=1 Tax=Bacteroides sp. TaxID=29523 RepID=UPI0023D3BF8A|nr:helix-turn-helix domain-containing protein [Bacteroides sp.]MDE6214841.1 helix-turn-helix domain-containing protein [Bacteroides sp.]